MWHKQGWSFAKVLKLLKTDWFVGLAILCIAYFYISHLKDGDRPVVKTKNGEVKGILAFSRDYQKYNAFLGIPYAKPPVNDLRFEPPQPVQNWVGVREAGQYRSQCISLELLFVGGVLFGQEDCLFLNVFAKISKGPLPVMVFFHGGMYHFGSAEDHGEKYFMDNEVIFVTVGYRLGALGFLSTGDSVVPGNNGLKDQVMALRWIKENIERFGGDPERIAIFGESAGGHAVGLHILSQMSKGLFHKAIIQSGAPITQWGILKQNAGKQAKRFASKFHCPTKNNIEMVSCLKKIDAWSLVYAHWEGIDFFRTRQMIFTATVEAATDNRTTFLSEDPEKILERGDFQKVPLIMGVNADEGLLQSSSLEANSTKLAILMNQFQLTLPVTLQYKRNDRITNQLLNYYLDKIDANSTREEILRNLTFLFGDRHFYHPTHKTAQLYSAHAPLYLYYFNHSSFHSMEHFIADRETRFLTQIHPILSLLINHTWRVVQEFILRIPVFGKGVCHGSELPLLFNHPWTPSFYSKLPERDVPLSKEITSLWVSFASSWNKPSFRKQPWHPVNPKEPFRYMEISTSSSGMIEQPFTDRVQFWKETFDRMEEPEVEIT